MTTRGIKPVGYFDCPGGGQVVVSGDVAYIAHIKPPHGTTIVDVSDPARPRKLAELTVPHNVHSHKVRVVDGASRLTGMTPSTWNDANGTGRVSSVAWFAHGLRIVDIANPHAPREVAAFVPPVPEGFKRVCSNDVCFDSRGLLYLIDRNRGLHILERI